jgi:hypothetical protein
MDDNTPQLRPMDADIDPIGWIARARAANRAKRYRDNHPEYAIKRKAYDAQRKDRRVSLLLIEPILVAHLLPLMQKA